MDTWVLPEELAQWISILSQGLHRRLAFRLATIMSGMLFAQGRRTVASWLRGAGVGEDFRLHYYFLGSLGRKTRCVASRLLHLLVRQIGIGERLVFGLDDSPTKRYGPQVEGAGIHHNPTPGPADQKFLYGHVWVTLAWLVPHPQWRTIALPVWALLYVRLKDIAKLVPWYRWKFQTKLELAAQLVEWITWCLSRLGKKVWIVADGAYAKRPFLRRALAAGVVIVSRLRKDAALFSLPDVPSPGERRGRGRPPKYGTDRISLAKRAGHRQGWQEEEFQLYGKRVMKRFKTFLATYPVVGGVIRVVLVQEEHDWVAYFCTDPNASVADILGLVADRSSIEQTFHDIKEVHGAGQQQLRNIWANLAAFNLNLWMYCLIELWAWTKSHAQLCDRSDSPWDDPDRRPSHADRRNALRRRCMETEFQAIRVVRPITRKIRALFDRVLALAA
jgi:hypothetical protein